MVEKKKWKKEMKELRRKVKRATARKEEYQREIKRLQQEISRRDQQIAELLRRKKKDTPAGSSNTASPKALHRIQKKSVATDQREAWKRFSYLRDRYEFYLAEGKNKADARVMANKDLVQSYGKEFGYTRQQLTDILS